MMSRLSASDADSADLMRPTVDLMPDSVNLMRGPLVAVDVLVRRDSGHVQSVRRHANKFHAHQIQ
jgi:hypothetical protein